MHIILEIAIFTETSFMVKHPVFFLCEYEVMTRVVLVNWALAPKK